MPTVSHDRDGELFAERATTSGGGSQQLTIADQGGMKVHYSRRHNR
jgi:hypothetical protein